MSVPGGYFNANDPNTPVGSSADIQARVLTVLPRKWWQWIAPVRNAIVGGLSDAAAWSYTFFQYALAQSRIATSTGPFLDIIAFDFLGRFLLRLGNSDALFRTQIMNTILQERVTRNGMTEVLTNLLNIAPTIIEPWNPGDCGGWSGPNQYCNASGYGKAGAWGSLLLPNQVFIRVSRSGLGPSGVPQVNGYGGYNGGYYGPHYSSNGATEYIGSVIAQIGVIDPIIENMITNTRPTGTTVWLYID